MTPCTRLNAAIQGVAPEQMAKLDRAYGIAERHLAGQRDWVAGAFSMADCAALPALFYAGVIHLFDAHPALSAYFDRLVERPSCARVLTEARPWFQYFPFQDRIPARFLTWRPLAFGPLFAISVAIQGVTTWPWKRTSTRPPPNSGSRRNGRQTTLLPQVPTQSRGRTAFRS